MEHGPEPAWIHVMKLIEGFRRRRDLRDEKAALQKSRGDLKSVGKITRWAAVVLRQKKRVVREDAMSIRIVFVILVAAVSMAFGFMPANAQQPRRAQPRQSLRLYVLDCGKITPASPA